MVEFNYKSKFTVPVQEEYKQWLKKKSEWTAVIKNYKKVKSLPKEKSTDRIYNELPAHYALLHDMNESMNLALSKKP